MAVADGDESHTTSDHPSMSRTTSDLYPDSDSDDLRNITSIASSSTSPPRATIPYRTASQQRRFIAKGKAGLRTPSIPMATTLPPSAPASPPTPAPSPSPQHRLPNWSEADVDEEKQHRDFRSRFKDAPAAQKERILAELMNLCDSRMLTFVHNIVCPRLKKDPFTTLPNEICLRILSFVDHPRTLARAAQVSKRWHELINDDMAWKALCDRHAYRKLSSGDDTDRGFDRRKLEEQPTPSLPYAFQQLSLGKTFSDRLATSSAPDLSTPTADSTLPEERRLSKREKHMSYRSHFKRRYMVETAWRTGGQMKARQITPDHGVVTSLHLTEKYIIVALDNAKIHVFDADGAHQKTLHGHMMGVWAMVPWGDILVSGGCDRDVRVWNMATGQSLHTLRGHSSTVRCLRMSDANTAITGSRDTTLRIWDIQSGFCKHVLVGHTASVRCLEVHGDLIASGSYDTTARIWSISEGKTLFTLHGHFSQIYAIAFDGRRVATGSLDTSVRIWDPQDGRCLAILQGHTSLVGQLQMRHSTLVTGGSDGSVRVWSLDTLSPIHRLAAHDNSVTSLQFNESRIISGGSDGRVKVWDLKTGTLVRELSQPAEAVWRVVFEEEKAVVMASRNQRTVMEVWNFAPPEDELALDLRNVSRSATASPSSPSARIMAELGTGMEQLLNRNVDRNPTNLLLTSAFVPPPSAPPAPTIMPVEAFPNLERQQSSSVNRQQASRQPIPQYSEQQHTRQVTQWNEQTAADLDALYGAGPSNFGAGGDAAANIGGSELRRHYSQHVATAGSPPPASTTVAPVTNVASPSPLARARSSWLQLNGSSGGRG